MLLLFHEAADAAAFCLQVRGMLVEERVGHSGLSIIVITKKCSGMTEGAALPVAATFYSPRASATA